MKKRRKWKIGTEELGLTEKELNRYSVMNAVRSLFDPIGMASEVGFEREISDTICKRDNRETKGILIPQEVLEQRRYSYMPRSGHILTGQVIRGEKPPNNRREALVKRGLMYGTNSAGGYLVDEELRSLIEVLVENTLALQNIPVWNVEGAPINIPVATNRPNIQSVAETGPVTETPLTFNQISFNPKFLRTRVDVSRTLQLLSSTDVEMFIRNDIAIGVAKAMDTALIFGTGTNQQPLGIKNTTGINTVTWDASNLYDTVLECQKLIGVRNIPMTNLKWLASWYFPNPMKTTKRLGAQSRRPIMGKDGKLNGLDVEITSQIPGITANLAEGYLGNWMEAAICLWQDLEIEVDQYTRLHEGLDRVIATLAMDMQALRPKAFSRLGG